MYAFGCARVYVRAPALAYLLHPRAMREYRHRAIRQPIISNSFRQAADTMKNTSLLFLLGNAKRKPVRQDNNQK